MVKENFEIIKEVLVNSYNPIKQDFNIKRRPSKRGFIYSETNERYTPRDIMEAFISSGNDLNKLLNIDETFLFDIDVATTDNNYITKISKNIFTKENSGLDNDWEGYVFCNPPFELHLFEQFYRKMIDHDNGILIAFESLSSDSKKGIIPNCDTIMSFKKPIHFVKPTGEIIPGSRYFTSFYAFGNKASLHLRLLKPYVEKYGPYILETEKGLSNKLSALIEK